MLCLNNKKLVGIIIALSIFGAKAVLFGAIERDPVKMRIVAINPSEKKAQEVPLKVYLPEELTPNDIVNLGEFKLDFDDSKSQYYIYKEPIELGPKETVVFNIQVRDVWFIQEERLDDLRKRTEDTLEEMKGTKQYEYFKPVAESIFNLLDKITALQKDDTIPPKERIGQYRNNLKNISKIKEDLDRMQGIAALRDEVLAKAGAGASEDDMFATKKAEAKPPTKTVTWMVIFIIIAFVGLLAGVFFFTWHKHSRSFEKIITSAREDAFPKEEPAAEKKTEVSEEKPGE